MPWNSKLSIDVACARDVKMCRTVEKREKVFCVSCAQATTDDNWQRNRVFIPNVTIVSNYASRCAPVGLK